MVAVLTIADSVNDRQVSANWKYVNKVWILFIAYLKSDVRIIKTQRCSINSAEAIQQDLVVAVNKL